MAKKRKKQEEAKAERDWKAPEFDREEYMRTEVNVAKGTIYAAIMAIPMALAAMYTMPVSGAGGGILVGLAGISFMWILFPYLKVDIKKFKPMHWLGAISTYFFLFLAIWVILCNPPFNDFASPAIVNVQVSFDGGDTWENIQASETIQNRLEALLPANLTANATMLVRATVTDNKELDQSSVMIEWGTGTPVLMAPLANDIYQYEIDNPSAPMVITITASDTGGNDPSSYVFNLV